MNKVVIIVAIALGPMLAAAEEGEHRRGGMFEQWDTNSDGVVTRDEAAQSAAEQAGRMFDKLDADGNGTLTRAEVGQAHEKRRAVIREKMEEHFRSADTNGDGSLSKEEAEKLMPRVARNFERLDTDRNGALSTEEFRSLRRHQEGPHGE